MTTTPPCCPKSPEPHVVLDEAVAKGSTKIVQATEEVAVRPVFLPT